MNTHPDQQEMLEAALAEARKRYAAAKSTNDKMRELAEIIRLEERIVRIGQ